MEWSLNYADIGPPVRVENGIKLELKQRKKGFMGIGSASGKLVRFNNPKMAEKIANRLALIYENYG